ncbi:MAG: 2,3-bisphosphoglycerate-independent phosphoglycerate mutase [Methanosarcinales archaeon]|nr:2,3-bisphosphoglycerate-independent phosphoglycerate mutase [Methanosarcinales archaeon]
MKIPKPLILIILDGWGINPRTEGNAVYHAHTPVMDRIISQYPNTTLDCAGEPVGLPEGQMGNSEVGHLNLGSGRVVYQDISKINKSIHDGDFYSNKSLLSAIEHVRTNSSSLHIMGLLSDGGVHSHIDHLFALLTMVKEAGIKQVYVHAFLDGRDVSPNCAGEYILKTEQKMKELGIGKIATLSGRYYAMDRDNRWERVRLAYDALTQGTGEMSHSAKDAVSDAYERGENDEFVRPTIINTNGNPTATIQDNDAVIFFNFRPDRAREITKALTMHDFSGFERKITPKVYFVCMTRYDETFDLPIAFPDQPLENTLSEYLSKLGKKQLHIAETEKYAHVTFFFNGGVEKPYKNEDRILIHSPLVATYDLKPEMSAYQVTDILVEKINSREYDVIIANYANPDMVGHTGIFDAALKAVETVDECLGRVLEAVASQGGAALILADHGNCEQMIYYEDKSPHTAHTTNPVPLIIVSDMNIDLRKGIFADIAPTILEILHLEVPPQMTGHSILDWKE